MWDLLLFLLQVCTCLVNFFPFFYIFSFLFAEIQTNNGPSTSSKVAPDTVGPEDVGNFYFFLSLLFILLVMTYNFLPDLLADDALNSEMEADNQENLASVRPGINTII